jgi:hypothetical protein
MLTLTTTHACRAVGSDALPQSLLATFRKFRVDAPVSCAVHGRSGRHNARLHRAQH